MFASLPSLGVGIGYRSELARDIFDSADHVDWLELVTEHYIQCTAERLDHARWLREHFPVVPHGIEMSIGTDGEVDSDYVDALAEFVALVDAPWCSDHLCFTRAGGIALGQLTPLPRTVELAATIARKAQGVQDRVGVPFLLENISYYVDFPSELTEAQFITEVMERCSCGLLLDLTNVHTNAVNHGFSALEFLTLLPMERVVQVHLAGGHWEQGTLLDSHSHAVPEDVWQLLAWTLERAPVRGILIERDDNFPADASELVGELDRARSMLSAAAGAR